MDFKGMEEKWRKHWEEIDLKTKRKEIRKGAKWFYLDGPPYANAPPHMGHLLTRFLRDAFVKYHQLRGHKVWLQPGFDTHGLPVESEVQKRTGMRTDEIEKDIKAFVELCRKHTLEFYDLWIRFYKYIPHLEWDLDNPYLTMNEDYINSVFYFLKKAYEKGLIYKGYKPVWWCPNCETSLSGYEATNDYIEIEDPSVYVRFRLKDKEREYLLIWTTTPWTLPSNLAISVNPKFEYALVKVGEDYYWIAKELVDYVAEKIGWEVYEVVKTLKGSEMEGWVYTHPLADKIPFHKTFEHKVILADFVSLEEGTGLVHTAPGHGNEDYEAGFKYGLPIFSPVDKKGYYTQEAGEYKGLMVFEANGLIINDLEERGALVHHTTIVHRYPVCWRCKTKLIQRASEQWFINVSKIKDELVKALDDIRWAPDWAGVRFKNWVLNAIDWCISRQRFWGIPLPFWVCDKCGKVEVLGSKQEIEEKYGKKLEDVHRPYIDEVTYPCSCGGTMKRISDVADVWLDSGAAPFASVGWPYKNKELFEEMYPVDFITEGIDQTRGWFYSLLVENVILFGKAPYKKVLVNGLVLDEKGEKMSKSKGNTVNPLEVIEKWGVDIPRFYLLSSVPWENRPWKESELREVQRFLIVYYNTFRYLKKYWEMYEERGGDFYPEDKWILSRLQFVKSQIENAFENLTPHIGVKALYDFILNDLSRDYIKFIRDRIREGDGRGSALSTLAKVFDVLPILTAPFIPYISEEIYHGWKPRRDSVLLEEWPEDMERDERIEDYLNIVRNILDLGLRLRNENKVPLRQPLRKVYVYSENPAVSESAKMFDDLLKRMLNVKEVCLEKVDNMVKEGDIFVWLDLEMDPELLKEGITRELVRRIQEMRKQMGLIEKDKIVVNIAGPSSLLQYMDEEKIRGITNTVDLKVSNAPVMEGFRKEWDVRGEKIIITVVKEE